MATIFVDLPTKWVMLDEARFPDRDANHIYEHLLHWCSLLQPADPLPTINVIVESSGPIVTIGHKYLKIAQQLGRPVIRAAIRTTSPSYDAEATAKLLSQPEVKQVDWQTILKSEELITQKWHVFFFERALQSDEKRDFEKTMPVFFRSMLLSMKPDWEKQPIISAVEYNDQLHLAQFQAWTPPWSESTFANLRHVLNLFNHQHVRLVSYQGLRFDFGDVSTQSSS
jgi:hypothetical protein